MIIKQYSVNWAKQKITRQQIHATTNIILPLITSTWIPTWIPKSSLVKGVAEKLIWDEVDVSEAESVDWL